VGVRVIEKVYINLHRFCRQIRESFDEARKSDSRDAKTPKMLVAHLVMVGFRFLLCPSRSTPAQNKNRTGIGTASSTFISPVTPAHYVGSMNSRRLCARILRGEVGNVAFGDLVQLLLDLDFRETSGRGSHRVFTRAGVIELVNLQVEKGDAKLYQVRQVANLIRQYNLKLKEGR